MKEKKEKKGEKYCNLIAARIGLRKTCARNTQISSESKRSDAIRALRGILDGRTGWMDSFFLGEMERRSPGRPRI